MALSEARFVRAGAWGATIGFAGALAAGAGTEPDAVASTRMHTAARPERGEQAVLQLIRPVGTVEAEDPRSTTHCFQVDEDALEGESIRRRKGGQLPLCAVFQQVRLGA